MNIFLLSLPNFILFFSLLFCNFFVYYHLNIAQKQFYEINRLAKYYVQHFKMFLIKILFYGGAFLSFYFHITWLELTCILLFYYPFGYHPIVPFHFTKRVIRFFILYNCVLLAILLYGWYKKISFSFFKVSLLGIIIYIFTYICIAFIERKIQKHYIKLAKEKLKKSNCKIIAITGSYGKTSVKNYIYELLKNEESVCVSPKSYNTLNGILLTINHDLKPYHTVLLLEVGVDKKNGMHPFLSLFQSDVVVITTIGKQHIATFKNIQNIISEKKKIYLTLKENGIAIINEDDENLKEYANKKLTCSLIHDANCLIESRENKNLSITINQKKYTCKCQLLGNHQKMNIALALCACMALGIKEDTLIKQIPLLKNPPHRLSLKKFHSWMIVDDAYNSNEVGFLNALEVIRTYKLPKILITPGIIENKEVNLDKLALAINESCDEVYFTSKNAVGLANKVRIKKHMYVSFQQAFHTLVLERIDEELVVLIENDLPDVYIK